MSTYADAPENPPETIRGIDLIPPWGDSPESMSYWHKDPMTGLYVSGPDSLPYSVVATRLDIANNTIQATAKLAPYFQSWDTLEKVKAVRALVSRASILKMNTADCSDVEKKAIRSALGEHNPVMVPFGGKVKKATADYASTMDTIGTEQCKRDDIAGLTGFDEKLNKYKKRIASYANRSAEGEAQLSTVSGPGVSTDRAESMIFDPDGLAIGAEPSGKSDALGASDPFAFLALETTSHMHSSGQTVAEPIRLEDQKATEQLEEEGSERSDVATAFQLSEDSGSQRSQRSGVSGIAGPSS